MAEQAHKRAVIYCRVSSLKQKTKGDGLESQVARCREFARMKGYDVIEVFRDDVSGKLIERPGMKAMLAFMRKNRGHGIVAIIDDISRLARDIKTHIELRSAISGAGGFLESPSIEFGTDSDSILVENLLASVSQHHRQKNGEQTKNRMRSRMLNGYWVFQAPQGYKYQRVAGRGMMLKRSEPVASILAEALEGYASGRFESQAEIVRFLEKQPLYPKQKDGRLFRSRVTMLLNQPLYAGYLEAPQWAVPLRPAQHEGLIGFQTYQRIQERLKESRPAPKRANINEEFPLRGFVLCDGCGTPLRSGFSTARNKTRHPYYLCQNRTCDSYPTSIRRADIESEFEALLKSVTPTENLVRLASAMFRDLWSQRQALAESQTKALAAELEKTEKAIGQVLDRMLETSLPSVIGAFENRVRQLEAQKLALEDRIVTSKRPRMGFDDTLRTALEFLSNPWKLWAEGTFEHRKMVLKLTFVERLRYRRNCGFRTASPSLPFKVLGDFSGGKMGMVGPVGLEPTTRPL